jgi:hypothetical protein
MSEPTYTCAVWYLDEYGQIDYELCENELGAAYDAAIYDGDGTVLGLQRADGSTVPAGVWLELEEAKHKLRELKEQRRRNQPPPPETRRAKDPFKGYTLDIEVEEPDWLGERRG